MEKYKSGEVHMLTTMEVKCTNLQCMKWNETKRIHINGNLVIIQWVLRRLTNIEFCLDFSKKLFYQIWHHVDISDL